MVCMFALFEDVQSLANAGIQAFNMCLGGASAYEVLIVSLQGLKTSYDLKKLSGKT